jgi:hypothetical protein
MTTPREDRSGRPDQRRNSGCAGFIGRVGALAVALGLGVAIANSPAIAAADTNESDASTSAASSADSSTSTGSTGPDDSPSAAKPVSSTAATSAGTSSTSPSTSAEPADVTEPADDETDQPLPDPTNDEPASTDPTPRKPKNHPAATAQPSATVESSTPSDTRSTERPEPEPVPAARTTVASTNRIETVEPRTAAIPMVLSTATAPPTPIHRINEPVSVVTGVVSGLLSAMGLAPQAAGGPVTPPQSPTLWAMLGWVRREIGHVFNPIAAPAAAVSTSAAAVAVSPLGTPQQLAAERLAAETANTLPVQLMKLVLRASFLSAAQREFALVGGPDQENLAQLNRAVDEYAMGAAFQQLLLNPNDPSIVMQVAPPHTWYGQDVDGSRILYDNPDTIYRFMPVNMASSYVITGRFAGGIPADTNFSVLTGLSGNTAANLSGRELEVDPDGTFTITVSGAPAALGQKNHLQLTSDSTLIATRNTLSDWTTQEPMSLSVQRVSGPPNSLLSQLGIFTIPVIGPLVSTNPFLTTLVSLIPPLAEPPPLLRGVLTAAVMALGISREAQYIAVATTDPATGERSQPNVLRNPSRNAEFLATQLQSAGYFQLADQEALIVTIDPGDARYFVVPVTNDWTITDDYWNQQTSLNNAQALANPDGTYTLVISPTDPGVANWVSTGGLNQGTISIRFQDLPLDPTDLPTVSSRVVTVDQLASILPASDFVTPAYRQAQIAARQAGFDNRFAPYPQ